LPSGPGCPTVPAHVNWQEARSVENFKAGCFALRQGHINAAASRLYYAIYLLSWSILESNAVRPSDLQADEKHRWLHGTLAAQSGKVAGYLKFSRQDAEDFHRAYKALESQRVQADYGEGGAQRPIVARERDRLEKIVERAFGYR